MGRCRCTITQHVVFSAVGHLLSLQLPHTSRQSKSTFFIRVTHLLSLENIAYVKIMSIVSLVSVAKDVVTYHLKVHAEQLIEAPRVGRRGLAKDKSKSTV